MIGQRAEQQVERSFLQPARKVLAQTFAHVKAQIRVPRVQIGDHERQEVGAERLDDTDADRSRKHGLPAACDLGDLVDLAEDAAGAVGDLLALGRHHDTGARAFHQLHAKLILELGELRRKRRLRDMRPLRRAAKMQRLGNEREVSELLEAGQVPAPYRFALSN